MERNERNETELQFWVFKEMLLQVKSLESVKCHVQNKVKMCTRDWLNAEFNCKDAVKYNDVQINILTRTPQLLLFFTYS